MCEGGGLLYCRSRHCRLGLSKNISENYRKKRVFLKTKVFEVTGVVKKTITRLSIVLTFLVCYYTYLSLWSEPRIERSDTIFCFTRDLAPIIVEFWKDVAFSLFEKLFMVHSVAASMLIKVFFYPVSRKLSLWLWHFPIPIQSLANPAVFIRLILFEFIPCRTIVSTSSSPCYLASATLSDFVIHFLQFTF